MKPRAKTRTQQNHRRVVAAVLTSAILFASAAQGADVTAWLFATDGANNLIRQYDHQGNEIAQIRNPSLRFPTLLTADSVTRTLITDINFIPGQDGPDLVRLDLQGNILARNSSQAIFGIAGGGIIDVAPSGRGTFYVTSTVKINGRIVEVDQNLRFIRSFDAGHAGDGLQTLGATTSPDGTTLYIADADGQSGHGFIRIFDTATGALVGTLMDPALEFPFALRFNDQGFLYVTDRGASFSDDRILVFDPSLTLVRQFNSGALVHDNFGPFDVLPNGNLILLESNSLTGTPIRILSPNGQLLFEFGSGLQNPNGIAVLAAPDHDRFLGDWVNLDGATRHLARVKITQSISGWSVRAWGACEPTECEWGETPFHLIADSVESKSYGNGFAIWDFGFVTAYVSFKIDGSQLGLDTIEIFHDASGRSNYHSVETLRHPPAISIRKVGTGINVQWPTTATNYELVRAINISSFSLWTAVADSPQVTDGYFSVTLPSLSEIQFFSLQRMH